LKAKLQSLRLRSSQNTNSILAEVQSTRLRASLEKVKLVYNIDYTTLDYFAEDYTKKAFLEG